MVITVVLGVFGLVLGVFVPVFANTLCLYKYAKKNRVLDPDPWTKNKWFLGICSLLSGLGFGICGFLATNLVVAVLSCLLWIMGLVIILVDIRIRLIPNEAVLALLIFGTVYQLVLFGLSGLGIAFVTMIAVVLTFLLLAKILGFGQIGAGDVKLAGAMAFVLGYPHVLPAFLLMAIGMAAYCVVGMKTYRLTRKSLFPYAPFIVGGMLGGMVYMLYLTK